MMRSFRFIPLLVSATLAACAAHPVQQAAVTPGKTAMQQPALPNAEARSYQPRHGNLTPTEMDMARVAWKYFENNYQPATGMVNAVDGYPSATMWDLASSLGGLEAAYELGLTDQHTFDTRLSRLLETMNKMDLFNGELPNKVYNTTNAQKVNYGNQPGEIGFSGIDLGRMLGWLDIIKQTHPEFGNEIDNVVLRWNFSNAVDTCGTIYGAVKGPDGKVNYVQEGRLGYEEYAAKGFQRWGFSTCLASRPEPYQTVPMYCVDVPYDTRDPRDTSQHNYVVSESYILDGIEYGWDKSRDDASTNGQYSDPVVKDFADRIYQVQEDRFKATGILTARSEHQLDQAPYFVYDTIYSDGFPWNTITDTGQFVPQFAAVASKAALGLWVLWNSPYTDLLANHIWNQYDPAKGYYEGVLENGKGPIRTFTANNNGIMLEELLFKAKGKLLRANHAEPLYKDRPPSMWDRALTNDYNGDNKTHGRPRVVVSDHRSLGGTSTVNQGKRCPLDTTTHDDSKCPVCPVCPICQDDAPVTLPAWSSCH